MAHRTLKGEHRLMRIHLDESDQLQRVLLERARAAGLAGCTILRATAGFGVSGHIHSSLSTPEGASLPIIVEIVEEKSRLDAFFEEVAPLLGGALVTEERAHVHAKAKPRE
jgi:PII-like signaling protein